MLRAFLRMFAPRRFRGVPAALAACLIALCLRAVPAQGGSASGAEAPLAFHETLEEVPAELRRAASLAEARAVEALWQAVAGLPLGENVAVFDLLDGGGPRDASNARQWVRDNAELVRAGVALDGSRAQATVRLSIRALQEKLGRGVAHPGDFVAASAEWRAPSADGAGQTAEANGSGGPPAWETWTLEIRRAATVPRHLWGSPEGLEAARLDALARARAELKARAFALEASPGRPFGAYLNAQPALREAVIARLEAVEPFAWERDGPERVFAVLRLDLAEIAAIAFPAEPEAAPALVPFQGGSRSRLVPSAPAGIALMPDASRGARGIIGPEESWREASWTVRGEHSLPSDQAADAENLARAREIARQQALETLRSRLLRLSPAPGRTVGGLAESDAALREAIERALAEAPSEVLRETAEGVVVASVTLRAAAVAEEIERALLAAAPEPLPAQGPQPAPKPSALELMPRAAPGQPPEPSPKGP